MGQAQVGNLCYWGRLTPSKPNAVRRGTAAQTRPAKHVGTGWQPVLLGNWGGGGIDTLSVRAYRNVHLAPQHV